jgi:hypothetical protein
MRTRSGLIYEKSGRQQYDMEARQRFSEAVSKRAKLQIRTYAPGDEAQILALCESVFGSSLNLEEWRWRNFGNPAGQGLVVVAQEKQSGRIIGHLAGVSTDLKVGDSSRKAFLLVDSVVEPSRQGRGAHAALTFEISRKACDREGGFGFGLPNKHAYLPTLKLGATRVLTVPLFFKVLDWKKLLRARLHSHFLANALGGLIQTFQRSSRARNPDTFSLREVNRFGDEADRLWHRTAPQCGISAIRTAIQLNWRYFECPKSPYRVFSVSRSGEWKGYVVIRMLEKWGLRLGTLVDLFFEPDCVEAGKLLINRAETELREQGANLLWGLFSAPESYQKLLSQAGFFRTLLRRTARPFHLLADFVSIEHLRSDLAERDGALLKQADQWFLSLGDTDLA